MKTVSIAMLYTLKKAAAIIYDPTVIIYGVKDDFISLFN